MPSDDRGRNEDLPELLDDLETTLGELRSELRRDTGPERSGETATRRTRPQPRPDLPRPPSASELLRFTEQYTLPTLISTLEATIRALELLRGTLRLVDPDRSAFEDSPERRGRSPALRLGDGVAGVGRGAVSGVERALSELEAALAEANVPEDRASNELLGEARDLSAEVRARIEAAQDAGTASRGDRQGSERRSPADPGTSGVEIEVTGAGDAGGSAATGSDREDEAPPEVDVEAELESIRHEVRGADGSDAVKTGESVPEPESENDAPDGSNTTGTPTDGGGDDGTDDDTEPAA